MKKTGPKPKRITLVWPSWVNPGMTHYCRHETAAEVLCAELDRDGFGTLTRISDVVLIDGYLEEGKKPTKRMMSERSVPFAAELRRSRPDVVVPIGAKVFEYVTGKQKITDWAGREMVTTEELGSTKCVPLFHPDQIARQPAKAREFTSQMRAMREIVQGTEIDLSDTDWVRIRHTRDVAALLRRLDTQEYVTFDFETTGLDPTEPGARIRCVGFCWEHGSAAVVDLESCPGAWRLVARWLMSSPVTKGCQNAKFERKWAIGIWGIEVLNLLEDTLLLHTALREEEGHKLELLAYQYTNIGGYDTPLKEALASGYDYKTVPMRTLWHYCAGDVDVTFRLTKRLHHELHQHRHWEKIQHNYRTVTIPATATLARVELNGMHIDPDNLTQVLSELIEEATVAQFRLDKYAPIKEAKKRRNLSPRDSFNVNSVPQVRELIYRVLRMPVVMTTKTGPSTKREALEPYAKKNRVIERMLALRSLRHAIGELEDYQERYRPDSCINSNLRQDVVVTGRLSSSGPNLQNIPRIGRVKEVFTSRDGDDGVILQGDFSQLEVRLLGSLSKEPALMRAFAEGIDPHANTAAGMYQIPVADVTDDQRTRGKRTGFGVIYGIGPKKLAAQVGRPGDFSYGQRMLSAYFTAHPQVERWMTSVHKSARKHGYVMNELGRCRHLPLAKSDDRWIRMRAERQAGNHPIQSLGSDITLLVMSNIERELDFRGLEAVIIGQVHDSILIDCPLHELEEVADLMHYWMTDWTKGNLPFLKIPLNADVTSGPDYKHQSKIHHTVPF